MSKHEKLSPEEEKQANLLSGISLACMFVPFILQMLTGLAFQPFSTVSPATASVLSAVLSSLDGAGFIAGIVLIIIVRVKYPANLFGRVLMWVYIVLAVIAIVLFVVAMIACTIACNSLVSYCQSCPD